MTRLFALRPKPQSLHHSDGRPCIACDWCDAWDRSKRVFVVVLLIASHLMVAAAIAAVIL